MLVKSRHGKRIPLAATKDQDDDQVSFADLREDIKSIERNLAYGSETAMWGDFVGRMHEIGIDPHEPGEQKIDATEAAWWREAYSALAADPSRETQDIYDQVG